MIIRTGGYQYHGIEHNHRKTGFMCFMYFPVGTCTAPKNCLFRMEKR